MILFPLILAIPGTIGTQYQLNPRVDKTSGKPNWQIGQPTARSQSTDTVIENKNVNIIVNVDPKDVAKELWSLIETHLQAKSGRKSMVGSMPRKIGIGELEEIIKPILGGASRRSNPPSVPEIATAFDHVTRQALRDGNPLRAPTIDDEIAIREIVALMMLKLKGIVESFRSNPLNPPPFINRQSQMMFYRPNPSNEDGALAGSPTIGSFMREQKIRNAYRRDDDFVRIVLNLRKSAILTGDVVYTDE